MNDREPFLRLEQREVIGGIHLHHLGGDDSRARDQPHLRGFLDHMLFVMGNNIDAQ